MATSEDQANSHWTRNSLKLDRAEKLFLHGCKAAEREELEKKCAHFALTISALDHELRCAKELISDLRNKLSDQLEKELDLKSARSRGGRLSSRNKMMQSIKYRVHKLYLECAAGKHPRIRTATDFIETALAEHPELSSTSAIRSWMEDWQNELEQIGSQGRTRFQINKRR